jgi:hypothetical protein
VLLCIVLLGQLANSLQASEKQVTCIIRSAFRSPAPPREKEAHNRAVVLEMIGDLPEADAKPPENMLFICKLNPVTTEEDLEIIFSRFGTITSCDIIRWPQQHMAMRGHTSFPLRLAHDCHARSSRG